MVILNKVPTFEYGHKEVFFTPSVNFNGDSITPMTDEQIFEDDIIHYGATHSVNGRLRKNKREGDIAVVSTASSGFSYSWSSYQSLDSLRTHFNAENKVVLWLQNNIDILSGLDDFLGVPVIKDKTTFTEISMRGYKGFPLVDIQDTSIIDPPNKIRYSSVGILSDDVCFWDGNNLYTLKKGERIEFGVN